MYKLLNYSEASAGIKEFVADTVKDLEDITNCEMGSSVYVIETSMVYVKNSAGEWVVRVEGKDGANGVTFIPSVEDGILSWTNDSNGKVDNPDPYDILGAVFASLKKAEEESV